MQAAVQPPALVILDFDGTLADSGPWVAGALNDCAARYGFSPLSPAEMEALRGLDAHGVLSRLGIPSWRVPAIARHMRARMTREIDAIRLFPGIPATLERLRATGTVLAVASSNTEANVRRVLGPAAACVTLFECGASLFGKAARFRRVLRRTGVAAGDALCIGDEVRDATAAARAGIGFAAVGWGYNTTVALAAHHPRFIAADPVELGNLLARASTIG